MSNFGQVIQVTGLGSGFPDEISRLGKRTITARQVLSTTANPISFGQACVINPATDTFQSVADFIAGGGTFTAALFAGVAIRNVKTSSNFTNAGGTTLTLGFYTQGTIAEVIEEGAVTIPVQVAVPGVPQTQGGVYIRTVVNSTYPSALVGGFEAVSDTGKNVLLSGVVWRTSQADNSGNGIYEIDILNRVAA